MSRAQQIFQRDFDSDFHALPADIRRRIQAAIDDMGENLHAFRHSHLTGSDFFRLRVGDYRVIYGFDVSKNELHLFAVGHRREIYR